MSYPSRFATVSALAAMATIGAMLFPGSRQAEASPAPAALKDIPAAPSLVDMVGYSKRYGRAYVQNDYFVDTAPGYRIKSKPRVKVNQEIKELQRMFPETNWPPSMRVNHY